MRANLDILIGKTSIVFGIHRNLLIGPSRERPATLARFAFFHVARNEIGIPVKLVGHACHRHHSTVVQGIESCQSWMRGHGDYRRKVEQLADFARRHYSGESALEEPLQTVTEEEKRRQRVVVHLLARLERMAIENPQGLDRLLQRYEGYDPANHL